MATKANIIEGKALWAKVLEPDTKYDANGVYSINILVPETEAQEVCEYLDSLVEAKFEEEVKANPKKRNTLSTRSAYDYYLDKDGNPTDMLEFKVKMKAQVQRRDGTTYEQKPIVVDAKRTPMTKDTLIGNMSKVKVAYEPYAYVMASTKQVGVTLRLKGVQVIELVEYTGGGSNDSMFDEEDGFVMPKHEAKEPTPFDDEVADVETEGDF
jgi:hypothetical protein